jgi:signal transduction histidine kinase/CheY-like chemotaxis protein
MFAFLRQFVDGQYAPHGYCLLWQPELVWTHVISDALIAGAYFSIPLALLYFVRKRRDVAFGGMVWLFALFILACGSTHLMSIWNLWHGDYGIEAGVKAVTALASVPTAILLWPLIPKALALPSPTQLQHANAELAALVAERDAAVATLRQEIAQREHAEAALVQARKIEAVGQLTGGIAHDFNNLLQAVAGNLELIRRKPDDRAKVERWASNAASVVDRGTRLTGQLLAFSRTQRLEQQRVDLPQLLSGMRDLLARSLGPGVQLEVNADPAACPVLADRTQIELAVLNLAINARDAMPDGGTVTIAIAQGDGVATIAIRDTGTGMTAEVAERALEPFFTTKGPEQGTGLGLSMAFGVARQAGGTLSIDTAPDRGTTVTMQLPCAPDDTPRAEAPAARAAGTMRGGRPRDVLLVDDDDDVRSALADTIGAAGHACRTAASGAEALVRIDEAPPEVLVVDYAMPGMTGAELAARVRATHPALRVVFVTGYADSAAIDAVSDARTVTLRKPFDADALIAAIAEA